MSDKVLVCDDEPYILESVAYIIEREGFEVLTAEDGEEALDVAKKENPKLIFLDVMMPKKTGYEVCEELKSNPDTKDIHIIMLTARGQDSDEQMAKDVGANEYMTKPFSPRKLRKRLRSLLG
ncbi:MAG: two-component system response regulator [Candidatus Cloacimonetes bacterium 4572_55]|nr:MAG: two-component system response regulator [Candidatus Cloacimonetes bacterium 4572_55]